MSSHGETNSKVLNAKISHKFQGIGLELTTHFSKFLSNIEPTYYQKSEASTGHETPRSRLRVDEDYREFFQDSFLSGSYGRDTAVRPINDVDVIVITNHNEP